MAAKRKAIASAGDVRHDPLEMDEANALTG